MAKFNYIKFVTEHKHELENIVVYAISDSDATEEDFDVDGYGRTPSVVKYISPSDPLHKVKLQKILRKAKIEQPHRSFKIVPLNRTRYMNSLGIDEGIRIDTSGDTPTFDISASDIEGEQLSRVDGITKKADHNVFYSLESAEGVENVKHFMDILKNNPENVDDSSMMNLIKFSIPEKVTYVAYLGSSQPLSRKIALWVKQLRRTEDIIKISKIQFKEIRHQIDHEIYSKQTPSIKNNLSTYVSTRSDDEDKSMKKTGTTQGIILSKLVNKYLLSPEKTRGEAPPIYEIIRNCIMDKTSTLLIVDDNIHSGNDFLKVMREIDLIKESLREAHKDNKYIHSAIDTSRHRIQGYTLYKLQDKDLNEHFQ